LKVPTANLLFLFFLVFYLFLFFTQTLYPFIDLPNHLAEATIFKFSDTSIFDGFYHVSAELEPNCVHYLFCNLFDDVEVGNRLFYAIYSILFPLLTYLLIKRLKGNIEFALLSFLLLFNYNVTFGFTGFTMAIPLVLLVFFLLCVDTTWSNLALPGLLILLFFTHILCLLFSLFLIFAMAIVKAKNLKTLLARTWSVIPVCVLLVIWQNNTFTSEQSTFSFLIEYYKNAYLPQLYLRSKLFIYDNFVLAEGVVGVSVALVFSCVIILPVLYGLMHSWINLDRVKIFYHSNQPVVVFFVVSFVCCFALPDELPGQGILYQRFSVFLFIGFILIGSLLKSIPFNRTIRFIGVFFIGLHAMLWYRYLSEFDRENAAFNASFFDNTIPKGKTLGGVMVDYKYKGRPVYIHFVNYYIVWSQGVATTKLIDYRFGSIRRLVSKDVLPEYQEWAGTNGMIPSEYKSLDFLLIRGVPKNLRNKMNSDENRWRIVPNRIETYE
jgi:hypothetical protein